MSAKTTHEAPKQQRPAGKIALACFLFIAFAAIPVHAQFTFWDRYDFSCDDGLGCVPWNNAQLAQGTDGNLYGTTLNGGTHAFGTIFMVTPSGSYTDLWEFDGVTGENPEGGLTLASDGNFYGVATNGGTFNCGTAFRFTPPNNLTVLHDFNCATDGWNPIAPPVQGADGNLYGAAFSGNIYTITLANGTFNALPGGAPEGVYAPLYLAWNGDLYGTSSLGGDYSQGTIFRVKTPSGAVTVMFSFDGFFFGQSPDSPVVQYSDGYLYGTSFGTSTPYPGYIYKMSLSGSIFAAYQFSPLSGSTNTDGANPDAGLLVASDGYLYGATSYGGANSLGTIYQFNPKTTAFKKLYDFTASGFQLPTHATNLIQHTNGSFFGVTSYLGANGNGVFYNLTKPNLLQILKVAGPIYVLPGGPVQILGNGLTQIATLNFANVPAVFQIVSDTQLTATVPFDAVDGVISGAYATGLPVQTVSSMRILPVITALDPLSGPVGTQVTISGGGFTKASTVKFGGVPTTSFTVVSPSIIQATVPSGFKKGTVMVFTPNGKATSTQKFTVQ